MYFLYKNVLWLPEFDFETSYILNIKRILSLVVPRHTVARPWENRSRGEKKRKEGREEIRKDD